MRTIRSIHAVDSHTMGEPTRIVVGGIPNIPGKTMAYKKKYLQENMDNIRTMAMYEPRGHNDMFGSIITAPVNDEADFGIIFMDGGGYLNMCGHGTIGATTVAIETGMIEAKTPITNVTLDTPAGLVKAKATIQNGKVIGISFVNVSAFLYKRDIKINLHEIGEITLDIAFGGSFFAILHANQLGLNVRPENAQELSKIGMKIRDIVNKDIEIKHPTLDHIRTVDLVEIYDEPTHPEANYKNIVIFGQGQFDRSPCGTGTCAKLATLHAKGEIKEKELFVYESIIGTIFKGRILGTGELGGYKTITPEITGSAYITGFNHFVIDPTDPVKEGFVVK